MAFGDWDRNGKCDMFDRIVEFAFFEAVNEEADCYNDEDTDEYWDDEELDDLCSDDDDEYDDYADEDVDDEAGDYKEGESQLSLEEAGSFYQQMVSEIKEWADANSEFIFNDILNDEGDDT
ncbi:MAG: hypothetical protein K5656_05935 [Lachnospiraceae bacterium]|nr:hypothetical protein [Lachnospiraceae bacterium]